MVGVRYPNDERNIYDDDERRKASETDHDGSVGFEKISAFNGKHSTPPLELG